MTLVVTVYTNGILIDWQYWYRSLLILVITVHWQISEDLTSFLIWKLTFQSNTDSFLLENLAGIEFDAPVDFNTSEQSEKRNSSLLKNDKQTSEKYDEIV